MESLWDSSLAFPKGITLSPDISHFLLRLSLTPGLQPGEKRRG
jgi:hypothetical protein